MHHNYLKISCAAIIATGLSFTAIAQESAQEKTSPPTLEASFAAADLDQNDVLDRDEFVSFAVMQAKAGDEAYKGTIMSGEYDMAFTSKDADADDGLSLDEVGAVQEEPDTDLEDTDAEDDLVAPEVE